MKSKTKTILIIVIIGGAIIGFVTFNIFKVLAMFSDDEKKDDVTNVAFSLVSPDKIETPTVSTTDLSDRDLLLSKQRPYIEGKQQMELGNKSREQSVSFSSIFTPTTDKKTSITQARSVQQQRDFSAELIPTREELIPKLTNNTTNNSASKPVKKSNANAADKAYEDLEQDIQTFYGNKSGSKKAAPKQPATASATPHAAVDEKPISDLARRRQALQNGFDMQQGEEIQTSNTSNTIIVATKGDQEVLNGQSVKLRVLEACTYQGLSIPKNTVLDGRVSFSNSNRLSIFVNAININRQYHAIDVKAYDMYGQPGLPLTIDKAMKIGTEEISDAVENVGRQTIGRTTVGRIITGSVSGIRREEKKTILILDAQKLILK